MWHVSITPLNCEGSWNIPMHAHIFASISGTPEGVIRADDLLGGLGFRAYNSSTYFPKLIGLERAP
jgi:hypothetical protein